MRITAVLLFCMIIVGSVLADESGDHKYVMNFDLLTKTADGEDGYTINLKGVHLHDGKPLHGDDLAEFEYFFTVSGIDENKGKLTIELYEYESRRKTSDVVSEIVSEVDFRFGEPGRFESRNERFGVDLAFSINQL